MHFAEKRPAVSIIMRTMNSAWSIAAALEGLFSQEFKDFELLIVDSDSTDGTREIIQRYPHRLMNVPAQAYYPGEVLNQAIESTSSDIIVFQNSDVVPMSPHTYTRLLAAFDDPGVQAAYARQVPRPEAEPWVRRDYTASFPEAGPAPSWITLSLPLAAMRRSIWRQHPFFSDAYSSEDTEWGHWAIRHGHTIAYVAEAQAMHSHNYTLRQIHGRRFVEGESDVFIYGGRDSLWGMCRRMAASIARDAIWDIRRGEWRDLAGSPARRLVYHWAYYRGHKLGEFRKDSGNTDRTRGHEAIKSRHNNLGE